MIVKNNSESSISKWYRISGIVNEENEFPSIDWDLKTPAGALVAAVGKEKIRDLHKFNYWFDFMMVTLAWALFLGSWFFLAAIDNVILWIILALFQSIIVTYLFYAIRHDTFMHRQVGGAKVAYFFGMIMSLPMMNTYTRFLRHEDHHAHIGYDLFEENIATLDKVWKRWFSLTIIGFVFFGLGGFKSKKTPQPNKSWKDPHILMKAKSIESLIRIVWLIGILTLTYFWPWFVLKGYVLPFLIFTPILYSLKIAGQHSETDINNVFHTAVFFKSNFIIRVLFLNSIGDAHVIHHIFPRISTWKLGKACTLLNEEIIKHKVPRRKFGEVLYRYYIKGDKYRERWI